MRRFCETSVTLRAVRGPGPWSASPVRGGAPRRSWTLPVLLVFAWALGGCGDGGSLTGPDGTVATFGACNVRPNYIAEVGLNRWRSFPLEYFFDAGSFDPDFVAIYEDAITDGIGRWAEATGNGLGTVVEVGDRAGADFVITSRDVTPSTAFARTIHATGTPFLAGGEIVFGSVALADSEELFRDGTLTPEVFFRGISGVAAHEMGHLLGIIGHPSGRDVLMGPVFHDVPTEADVNTLVHAYCE